jgi:hypothetical protein
MVSFLMLELCFRHGVSNFTAETNMAVMDEMGGFSKTSQVVTKQQQYSGPSFLQSLAKDEDSLVAVESELW